MIHFGLIEKIITFLILSPVMIIVLRKKRKDKYKLLYGFAFWIYLVEFIGFVFFPILLDLHMNDFEPAINLIPFKTIKQMWEYGNDEFIKQVIGNIALFFPMGFLLPLIFEKINKYSKVVLLGIIISTLVEILQLAMDMLIEFNVKVCDIDDLILNVIGILLGFMFQKIVRKYIISKYLIVEK